jgi:hypothetical protein
MKKVKIEIKWAIIFSIMTLMWMLLEKLSGLHSTHIDKHMYLTNLFAIPAILIYVLALKDKKNNFYDGKITYKQGLISGIFLSLIITLITPLTQWITSYLITPEYFPNVIKYSLETGFYNTLDEAEAFFNYKNYAIQGFIWAFAFGVATTLIVMIFLRTRNVK